MIFSNDATDWVSAAGASGAAQSVSSVSSGMETKGGIMRMGNVRLRVRTVERVL
jgi:formylmethanofuran dehydrogenase subunit B